MARRLATFGKLGRRGRSTKARTTVFVGDPNAVVIAAVDSATVIAVGDLLYLNTDDARPANMLADAGSKTLNQSGFHDYFLGVAIDPSANGVSLPIRLYWRGRFTYPCASANFEIGDLMAVDTTTGAWPLNPKKVIKVASTSSAIGRCAKRGTALTMVEVEIVSTIMAGGPMPA